MIRLLLIILIILFSVIPTIVSYYDDEWEYESYSYYCGYIDRSEAQGAHGYFMMKSGKGEMAYSMRIDMSKFNNSGDCDLSQGISYHIHSYWTNSSVDSSAGDYCGSDYTGGHFDPGLACSSKSEYASTYCADIGRTSDNGYEYSCSTDMYSSKKYALCEVGDLSTKTGVIYETETGSLLFSASNVKDYNPPYVGNYKQSDDVSEMWSSIVIHCNEDSSRLVCANMIYSSSKCDTKYEEDDDNDDVVLDSVDITLIVLGAFIVLVSIGLCLVIYCHYYATPTITEVESQPLL